MKADVLIIDGRHSLYRSSDAFRDLSAEIDGETVATGGMYGFLGILQRVYQRYSGKVIVAWEGEGKNFRIALYPSYKHKDEPIDDLKAEFISEMVRQEKMLIQMLHDMGVDQYFGVDCEADDVIACLSREQSAMGKMVAIYSGDSDLRQLVKENVVVIAHERRNGGASDKVYDEAAVMEKHGVVPKLIAQLKALSGDHSDNIPGLPGIGPKTAATLLSGCGSLLEVIRCASSRHREWPSTPRIRLIVKMHCHKLSLYYKLTKVNFGCQKRFLKGKADQAKVLSHLKRYKFRSFTSPGDLHDLMSMGQVA